MGRAIESALDQTYDPVEVIVIDDGSTDNSLDNIRIYENYIEWQTCPNRGAAAARNTGWKSSRGEYIKFLDADDILAQDIVEAQMSYIDINDLTKSEIVYGNVNAIEDLNCVRNFSYSPPKSNDDIILHLLKNNIQTSCPMYTKKMLNKVGGFDEKLDRRQEYDLNIRLALNNAEFIYLDKTAVYKMQDNRSDRIQNTKFLKKSPLSSYNILSKIMGNIENKRTYLSLSVREFFAKQFWRCGRQVLRYGYKDKANKYFSQARNLQSDGCVVGSFLYKVLVYMFDPFTAEYLLQGLKNKVVSWKDTGK